MRASGKVRILMRKTAKLFQDIVGKVFDLLVEFRD